MSKKDVFHYTPANLEALARRAELLQSEIDTPVDEEASEYLKTHIPLSEQVLGSEEEIMNTPEEFTSARRKRRGPEAKGKKVKPGFRDPEFTRASNPRIMNERNKRLLLALTKAPDVAKFFATEYALDIPEFELSAETKYEDLMKLMGAKMSPTQIRERRIAWKKAREYLYRRKKFFINISHKEYFLFQQAVNKIGHCLPSQKINDALVLRRIIVEFAVKTLLSRGLSEVKHLRFQEYKSLDLHTEAVLLDVMVKFLTAELKEKGNFDEHRKAIKLQTVKAEQEELAKIEAEEAEINRKHLEGSLS